VLFVCSRNQLRSPTAEQLFSGWPGIEVASAGLDPKCREPVTPELLAWAEVIFVMEKSHRNRLLKQFRASIKNHKIVVLGVTDDYEYMDPCLVRLFEALVPRHLGMAGKRDRAMKDELWLSEALRRFPQLGERLTEADTPYMVWIELRHVFEDAYKSGDEALIGGIYQYAAWCCRQLAGKTAEDDLRTCVAACFFEHIPEHPKALHDMPRWWTIENVVLMKQIFSYHAGEDGYAKILSRFAEQGVSDIRRIPWDLEE
jgi:predicted protein tyrosine phosphatase